MDLHGVDFGMFDLQEINEHNLNAFFDLDAKGETLTKIKMQNYNNITVIDLTNVTKLTKIDSKVKFNLFNNLEIVIMPNIIEMKGAVFEGCGKLKSVILNSRVRNLKDLIQPKTFLNCNNLVSIKANSTLLSYLSGYFLLPTNIYFGDVKKKCKSIEGESTNISTLFIIDEEINENNYSNYLDLEPINDTSYLNGNFKITKLKCLIENNDLSNEFKTIIQTINLTRIKINDKYILEIGDDVFKDCKNLEIVNLGMVKIIGKNAFQNCKKLNNIKTRKNDTDKNILRNVTKIDDNAFEGCNIEPKLELHSADKIGNYVFKNCKKLQTIKFMQIHNLGSYVFSGCEELKAICLNEGKNKIEIIITNGYAFDDINEHYSIYANTNLISYILANRNNYFTGYFPEIDFSTIGDEITSKPKYIFGHPEVMILTKHRSGTRLEIEIKPARLGGGYRKKKLTIRKNKNNNKKTKKSKRKSSRKKRTRNSRRK